MTEMLQLMAAPLTACVVLLGIHVYLGMHVIQRKLIFVDLALAQIAALGATMGFLLGLSPHGGGAFFFSLLFAVGGAAIFTLTRMRREQVPQEAIIGIVYVVALASAILIADRAPEGAEHIKESLVGSILWVSWPTIFQTAVLYVIIGAIHFAFRERFLQLSFNLEQAYAEKRLILFWDFLFYVTFAFVITSAVAIAGVLLVFSFLVIPAVVACLFSARVLPRLIIGWSVGVAACLAGLVASYRFDTPSGPTVVASLGFTLVLAGLYSYVRSAESRGSAALKVVGGVALLAGLAAVLAVFLAPGRLAQIEHHHEWEAAERDETAHHIEHDIEQCGEHLECMAAKLREDGHWQDALGERLIDANPAVREQTARLLGVLDNAEARDLLAATIASEPDPLLRLDEARILVAAGDRRGLEAAVDLLESDVPLLVREDAHQLLRDASGSEFGYDPAADGPANAGALGDWRNWAATGTFPTTL